MTWDGWCQGATLFLFGLFRKVAVADVLGPPVGQVFADPAHCSPGVLLFGAYGFALQVYADFSGYSDMARGIARIIIGETLEGEADKSAALTLDPEVADQFAIYGLK